jgi:hypothetical protein
MPRWGTNAVSILTTVDGAGAREHGLGLELAFATRGVYELLHLRAHVAIASRVPQAMPSAPAERADAVNLLFTP